MERLSRLAVGDSRVLGHPDIGSRWGRCGRRRKGRASARRGGGSGGGTARFGSSMVQSPLRVFIGVVQGHCSTYEWRPAAPRRFVVRKRITVQGVRGCYGALQSLFASRRSYSFHFCKPSEHHQTSFQPVSTESCSAGKHPAQLFAAAHIQPEFEQMQPSSNQSILFKRTTCSKNASRSASVAKTEHRYTTTRDCTNYGRKKHHVGLPLANA